MLPSYIFGTPIANGGQTVAYTGTQGNSTAITNTTGVVRLTSSTNCWVEIGGNGTTPTVSTTTSIFLPLGRPEYFAISKGAVIGVKQDSAGGNLYITVC